MLHPDPIVRRFHTAFLAGVPVCLWGGPGVGKTARVMAYAANRLPIERWLLSRCEGIDLKPRSFAVDGSIVVTDPPEIARLRVKGGVLFLDELNRAPRDVEGAALDIIDNPPHGVSVIAACNPQTRGQASRNLESAAANRFCHLDVVPDPTAWSNAILNGWPTGDSSTFEPPDPEKVERALAKTSFLVSSFIRRRSELLEKEPPDPVQAGKAWPSTRTWDHLRRIEAFAIAQGLDAGTGPGMELTDRLALAAGCVGNGPATEFLAFAQDADLVDPEAVLLNPSSFEPDRGRPDRTIAALTSIAGAVSSNLTEPRWKASWACIQRCVEAEQMDAAVVGSDMINAVYARFKDSVKKSALTLPHKLVPVRVAQIIASKG